MAGAAGRNLGGGPGATPGPLRRSDSIPDRRAHGREPRADLSGHTVAERRGTFTRTSPSGNAPSVASAPDGGSRDRSHRMSFHDAAFAALRCLPVRLPRFDGWRGLAGRFGGTVAVGCFVALALATDTRSRRASLTAVASRNTSATSGSSRITLVPSR